MFSLKENVKRLFKKKQRNMKNCIGLHFTLFSCFCFRLLWLYGSYFWILFQFCGLILYFCVCFRLGMLISVLGFVFLFSGSVFCFGFVTSIFVVVVLVLWFFCFYQPPYIFDSPLHLNPTTGEHFKTPLKISSQRSHRSGKK